MVPIDEGDLRKPLPPLPQDLPLPLPLRPPKAPATQAVSMPKKQHWLQALGPVPKGEPKASTGGKAMSKPPEGNVKAKAMVPMPPNLADIFVPHAREKKAPRKHDGGIPDTGGPGYPEPKALKKGQPQAAASSGSHGRPQAATLSSVPEQEVAVPEQEVASSQPQAARGFPTRTMVRDPASGEMISVKRNPRHGLWSPCHSSEGSEAEEAPTEQVPAEEEPEEVTAEEEPEEASAEEGTREWTPVAGPRLFRNRAGFLVNEKEQKNK